MATRGRTPEKGPRVRTWTHDKCDGGDERTGWIAGDVFVLLSHVGKGRSKPCDKALLGEKARCKGCEDQRPREDLGYVPLRRDDGRPMCVVIRKATIEFVGAIKPGTPVVWGRRDDRFEGVFVRPNVKGLPWSKFYAEAPNDDLSVWLPTFLAVPHLAAAMRLYFAPAEHIPEPIEPPVIEQAPAPTPAPVVPRRLRDRNVQALPELVGSIEREVLRKVKAMEAERNGVHHKGE